MCVQPLVMLIKCSVCHIPATWKLSIFGPMFMWTYIIGLGVELSIKIYASDVKSLCITQFVHK